MWPKAHPQGGSFSSCPLPTKAEWGNAGLDGEGQRPFRTVFWGHRSQASQPGWWNVTDTEVPTPGGSETARELVFVPAEMRGGSMLSTGCLEVWTLEVQVLLLNGDLGQVNFLFWPQQSW